MRVGRRTLRWLLVAVAVVVVGAVVFVVQHRDRAPFDDRAYPSSRWDRSLAQLLDQFHVRLPDCPTDGLRYWSSDGIDDDFYLAFRADAGCVDAFREANGFAELTPLAGSVLADNRDDRRREWGWYDGGQSYLRGRVRPVSGTELTVEMTDSGPTRQVYLRGVEF
ncbi:hypothetical protein [Micromonospora sp. RP3T]|uniref:hypothetical protein n=1 Tax=Micromonospora sp. RP3T TaxID=2135446 RepID=UPI0011B27161|nr:hypothetical protein [Micromonospora sp. RP3T]